MKKLYNFSVFAVAFIFLVPACTLNRNANLNIRNSPCNSAKQGNIQKTAISRSQHLAKAIQIEKIYYPAPKLVEVTYLSGRSHTRQSEYQKIDGANFFAEKVNSKVSNSNPIASKSIEQTNVNPKLIELNIPAAIHVDDYMTNSEELQNLDEYKPSVQAQSKKARKASDLMLYLSSLGLLGFAIAGIRNFRSRILKVSRWANQNKKKAKWIIALSQLALTFAGMQLGKELHTIGFQFSNSMQYIFGGIAFTTFVGMLRIEKMQMTMPVFFMRKAGNCILGMSLFFVSIGVGHNLKSNDKQISPIGYVAEYFQNEANANNQELPFIHEQSTLSVDPAPTESPVSSGRIALYIFLALLLLCVLFALSCMVFCFEYVLAGLAVSLLSAFIMFIVIRGIVRVAKRGKA